MFLCLQFLASNNWTIKQIIYLKREEKKYLINYCDAWNNSKIVKTKIKPIYHWFHFKPPVITNHLYKYLTRLIQLHIINQKIVLIIYTITYSYIPSFLLMHQPNQKKKILHLKTSNDRPFQWCIFVLYLCVEIYIIVQFTIHSFSILCMSMHAWSKYLIITDKSETHQLFMKIFQNLCKRISTYWNMYLCN